MTRHAPYLIAAITPIYIRRQRVAVREERDGG